jgi:hypothetical protein
LTLAKVGNLEDGRLPNGLESLVCFHFPLDSHAIDTRHYVTGSEIDPAPRLNGSKLHDAPARESARRQARLDRQMRQKAAKPGIYDPLDVSSLQGSLLSYGRGRRDAGGRWRRALRPEPSWRHRFINIWVLGGDTPGAHQRQGRHAQTWVEPTSVDPG